MCDDQKLADCARVSMSFPQEAALIPLHQPVRAAVLGHRDKSICQIVNALREHVPSTKATFQACEVYQDMNAEKVTALSEQFDLLVIGGHLMAWHHESLFQTLHCPVIFADPSLVFHPYQASCRHMFLSRGFTVLPAQTPDRITQSITAIAARKWLGESRMLIVWEPEDTHPMRGDIHARSQSMHQLLGANIITIPVSRLQLMASQVTDTQAVQVWEHWKNTLFSEIDPALSQAHLNDTARLYVAMRQLVDEHQANAMAVEDIGAFLFHKKAMPNLAHTALRAQGITTAEEGDLAMLITQMILASVNQQQAMMSNVYVGYRDAWEANKEHGEYTPASIAADFHQSMAEKTVLLCHFATAGIVPRSMTDDTRYRVIQTLPSWIGQSMSFAIPKLGEVLLARLDETTNELHVYPGTVTNTYDDLEGGWYRGRWLVHLPGIEHFVDHGFSAHYAICMQPQLPSLQTLCKMLGITLCLHEG